MEAQDITTPQGTRHYKPKGIPIERMLQLRDKDLTDQQIADLLGCDRSNVTKRLALHAPRMERLDNFKKYRADILTDLQIKVLDHVTDNKLNEATATQLITGMAILYDKERLERGQSTANMSVQSLVESHKTGLEGLKEALSAQLKDLE